MVVAALDLGGRLAALLAAGVAAGVANALVGGGTFIAFPTLLGLGIPALQANLSTTVGVGPSYLGSLRVFRREVRTHRRLVLALVPWCVVGSLAGTALLLHGAATTFRDVVPWLVGTATLLFAFAPWLTARLERHRHGARSRVALAIGVLLVSAYGGYFGAGLGILLLAVTALTLPLDVHELQGLRNVLSLVINVTAVVVFLIHGHLAVEAVVTLATGTLVGGALGALVVRRLSAPAVRAVVVAVGLATTLWLALS